MSLGVMLGFSFATADVQGAYMQSGPAQREIYVRPPREFHQRGKVWKLSRLPYGIVEAGRQWLCAIEQWMKECFLMNCVSGVDQLFVRRTEVGDIELLIAKFVDDFLISGTRDSISIFLREINLKFKLGSSSVGRQLKFLGCDIDILPDGSIDMGMEPYLKRIRPIQISRERRAVPKHLADARERSEFRSLAGTLLYLGQAILQQAAMVASRMQQNLGLLRVLHIIDANRMLLELQSLLPRILFRNISDIAEVMVSTMSDALHGASDDIYGQTGSITGLKIMTENPRTTYFHPIAWSSHKQIRVSYSSFRAEIIAAAYGDDRGFDLKLSLLSLFPHRPVKYQLFIDSKALFETITTLHQTNDYRLRKTVAHIRASFESGELDIVHWLPGTENYADVLTKRNIPLSKRLSELLNTGNCDVQENLGVALDSASWA